MSEAIQENLPGFEPYPEMQHSLLPDYNLLLNKKVTAGGFDPHAVMMQRKQEESGVEPVRTPATKSWSEAERKDIEALELFCSQHGIVGFNCGRMSPIAALAFLKGKLGIVDGPYETRVPAGYQQYSANNKYQPTILHG